jgi:ABC-2 type transport system ATP-binding protein
MIQANDLTKRYDTHLALDGLNLDVAPGSVLALFGGNGAGKSTTINLFLGFIEPTRGQALVGGVEVAKDPAGAKRRLAYVAENVMLYGHASARENLQYFAELAGRRLSIKEAHGMLEAAGLDPAAHERQVRSFSKGMRQKCGLAIAFAKDAEALFLDEPFSGLDPLSASELAETIRRVKGEGRAVLMSTHDLFRARAIADTLGIMRRGKLVKHLTAAEAAAVDLERLYVETMTEPQGASC